MKSIVTRFNQHLVRFIPDAGTSTPLAETFRLVLEELVTQSLGKERVVAIPFSSLVQSAHKEIGLAQLLQHRLTPALSSNRVTKRAGETLQNACPQQKGAHLRRHMSQDLFAEILQKRTVISAKRAEKRLAV